MGLKLSAMDASEWVTHEDDVAFGGRVERLEWLIAHTPLNDMWLFVGGVAARQLFEETRYNFVYGQFLACVLLSLAFIEISLASKFYAAGRDDLQRASLSKLLKEAFNSNWLSKQEYDLIHKVRKLRNPVAHFRPIMDDEGVVRRMLDSNMSQEEIMESDAKVAIVAMFHSLERVSI